MLKIGFIRSPFISLYMNYIILKKSFIHIIFKKLIGIRCGVKEGTFSSLGSSFQNNFSLSHKLFKKQLYQGYL